jgi:kynureninase
VSPPNPIGHDRAGRPPGAIAGFLALRAPGAEALRAELRRRGVQTDHRADVLRLGPAPYLSDAQLLEAVGILGECVRARGAPPRRGVGASDAES